MLADLKLISSQNKSPWLATADLCALQILPEKETSVWKHIICLTSSWVFVLHNLPKVYLKVDVFSLFPPHFVFKRTHKEEDRSLNTWRGVRNYKIKICCFRTGSPSIHRGRDSSYLSGAPCFIKTPAYNRPFNHENAKRRPDSDMEFLALEDWTIECDHLKGCWRHSFSPLNYISWNVSLLSMDLKKITL